MATTSQRTGAITFSGDVNAQISLATVTNPLAPGDIDLFALSTGANTMTLPTGGSTPTGAIIIPPPGNTVALTLKGVGGDTGIALSKVDPAIITFDNPPPVSFVINAANVVNLRVIWT